MGTYRSIKCTTKNGVCECLPRFCLCLTSEPKMATRSQKLALVWKCDSKKIAGMVYLIKRDNKQLPLKPTCRLKSAAQSIAVQKVLHLLIVGRSQFHFKSLKVCKPFVYSKMQMIRLGAREEGLQILQVLKKADGHECSKNWNADLEHEFTCHLFGVADHLFCKNAFRVTW